MVWLSNLFKKYVPLEEKNNCLIDLVSFLICFDRKFPVHWKILKKCQSLRKFYHLFFKFQLDHLSFYFLEKYSKVGDRRQGWPEGSLFNSYYTEFHCLHVNAHKTEYMCFNQTVDICTRDGTSPKVADKFTYLGSSVSSPEKEIDTRLTKAWTAIDRLSRSKDKFISDVFLWTPTYGRAKAGRPARTYI